MMVANNFTVNFRPQQQNNQLHQLDLPLQQQQQQQQQRNIVKLENDDCPETLHREKNFLSQYAIRPYTYTIDDVSTIIYSRTMKTHYRWPIELPITVDSLDEFKDLGHTLGIDYTKSYARHFALDLDCICRKLSTCINHLDETLANAVSLHVTNTLQETLGIKDVKCDLWRNRCGFHIYTDVLVSLPTHLYLQEIVASKFRQEKVIIEVPSIMPLPYSAKSPYKPYQPATMQSQNSDLIFTNHEHSSFYDLFVYERVPIENNTIFTLNLKSSDEIYLNKISKAVKNSTPPQLLQIDHATIHPKHQYMKQFSDYIKSVIESYLEITTVIGDVDLSEFSATVRFDIEKFMIVFNKMFAYQDSCESCSLFIKFSAEDYGGLYLQPFVAALHKYLNTLDDIQEFRKILYAIYGRLYSHNRALKIFVDRYDLVTTQAYTDTYIDILKHLQYLISNNVDPTVSFNEQIDQIMRIETQASSQDILLTIQSCPKKDEQSVKIDLVLGKFAEILKQMRVVYFDRASARYHVLDSQYGAFYESHESLSASHLPYVIRKWIGDTVNATTRLKHFIDNKQSSFIIEPPKLTQCHFMFATTVGVWNSAIGLYSAKTCLLRFSKYRYYSVWDIKQDPYKPYLNLNYDVVEKCTIVEKYVQFLHTKVTDFYIYAIVAPALIQMRRLMSIEEHRIASMFKNLAAHTDDLSAAHFLIDYFPIDPKFIYLLYYLFNTYDGLDVLVVYKKLCSHVFLHHNDITEESWRDKFSNLMSNVQYDDTRSTYREKLHTLRGPHGEDLDDDTCLTLVLIAACMIRCQSFNTLTRAFNLTLGEPSKTHPDFEDIEYSTTLQTFRSNVNRAKNIMFGKNLSDFESRLIDECISLCISANFNPPTVVELLDSVSLLFVTYNKLKKLILLYGPGNVGKSYFCDKLQLMLSPMVARLGSLSKTLDRVQITSETNITIINEVNELVPSELKSITGNDPISSPIFYSQKLEMKLEQSQMYGATNIPISFKAKNCEVDRTLINRLHAILFRGCHVNPEDKQANFLTMMTESKYYTAIFKSTKEEAANSLVWLAFSSYLMRRDENLYPILDDQNPACREYKNTVYYNNNRLYRFLVNCGLVEETNFRISKTKLLDIVKKHLDKNDKDSFQTLNSFKVQFEHQYNFKFNGNEQHILHLQQSGLVQHVHLNMAVVKNESSTITLEDIENRLKIYTDIDDRDNAMGYFQKQNTLFYNYNTRVYEGIAFQNDSFSYDGNETIDLLMPLIAAANTTSNSSITELTSPSYSSSSSSSSSSSLLSITADKYQNPHKNSLVFNLV